MISIAQIAACFEIKQGFDWSTEFPSCDIFSQKQI